MRLSGYWGLGKGSSPRGSIYAQLQYNEDMVLRSFASLGTCIGVLDAPPRSSTDAIDRVGILQGRDSSGEGKKGGRENQGNELTIPLSTQPTMAVPIWLSNQANGTNRSDSPSHSHQPPHLPAPQMYLPPLPSPSPQVFLSAGRVSHSHPLPRR